MPSMRALLIAAALALLSCDDAASGDRALRVVRVIDGDTIWVQGSGPVEKIRLLGIDAPEMNYGKGRPECGAADATRALRARIDGRAVILDRRGRDDYGRTLAVVIDPASARERNVNEWLLREGYAEIFWKARHPDRERFIAIAREARAKKRGMWRCGGAR